jgi:hypothetical protein
VIVFALSPSVMTEIILSKLAAIVAIPLSKDFSEIQFNTFGQKW